MCSVSLRPEVCRSIGVVEVPMLNVALSRVRAPKMISGCRQYDNGLCSARIFRQWRSVVEIHVYSILLRICMCTQIKDI